MKGSVFGGALISDLEERIEKIRPRRKGLARKPLQQLATALLRRADETYLLENADGGWIEDAEEILAFAQSRPQDEILVQVSAPRGQRSQGGESSYVHTCMPDQPFIVDSIRLAFEQRGLELRTQVNMILPVDRAASGKVRQFGEETSEFELESITHFEISPVAEKKQREELRQAIAERLSQAQAVAGDFRRMLRQLKDTINQYELVESVLGGHADALAEARHFMQWLAEEHFVFMGMIETDPKGRVRQDMRLGLSRLAKNPFDHSRRELREFLRGKREPFVFIHKTGEETSLHRRGKIDEILIRRFDDKGQFTGCLALHGLFTYRAISARGGAVPLLRTKLREVVRLEDVRAKTYNYKAIVNAFNSLPVEYLFGASVPDVRQLIRRSLVAERSRRLEVHLSLSQSKRSAFLFVVMPRLNFNDRLRAQIEQHVLERLGANYSDHRVHMSAYGVAMLHFYFTSRRTFRDVAAADLERAIITISASWQDRFREVLLENLPRQSAKELFRVYQGAFSPRYQVSTEPEQVLVDVQHLETVRTEGRTCFDLYWDEEDHAQDTVKMRIHAARNLHLTDVLPILDNFGLNVINSFTNGVRIDGHRRLFMHTFRFQAEDLDQLEGPSRRAEFLEAIAAVFEGHMANDLLNRILLPARLTWPQVAVLRSYQSYSKQLGHMSTPGTVWSILVRHASIVRRVIGLFEAKFGPEKSGKIAAKPLNSRRRNVRALRDELFSAIDAVQSFAEDRVLRILANLVEATLRTNFYAAHRPHPSIAHKIDCTQVASMRDPKPWREIYVHHSELEGVHLRGGRIARGGLRWSDRLEDFRTEILGLMTTQMVKNVVIVPVGAKGGFVLKQPPAAGAALRQRADELYEVFIHSLLDLTDDVSGARTVPPRDVVCYDDPDPYLVVAADKGTAHLSDAANAISEGRGFWMGDAFASGGSNGYDHKAVGITARGAWVCIRHLLAELDIDAIRQPFTAVGIGDMGGDVFGNGMIEHDTIRLVGAFNHLHVFLDPNPDPKTSYRERKRLFAAKQGGWDHYDPKKISKGGGVFDRQAKSIPLSAPVRKLLGTERTSMSGNELVHEILKLDVDLWYNGGIGTYVKSSTEDQAAAHDPSNDAVRVNADEMGARVVGEGGNLGFTQQARIEFARRGGRINTDFIDNAGGVNISDHEVNLKILLQPQVAQGKLAMSSRNRLLRDMEPFITGDVLAANGDQALLLSLDELRSRENLAPFDGVMDEVCRRFSVKRSALVLPSVREIGARMEAGEGLTRPELATLSSYVKMMLYEDLVEDTEVDLEGILPSLRNYFPERVRKRFRGAIDAHRLGREIALTRLTNRIIDYTGTAFFHEMAAACDASARQAFEAYSLLSRAADAWNLKIRIEALGNQLPTQARYRLMLTVESALRAGTQYLLESWSEKRIQEALRQTGPYQKKLRNLADAFERVLDPASLEHAHELAQYFEAHGVPPKIAQRASMFPALPSGLVIQDLADQVKRPPNALARDYFALGRASSLLPAMRRVDELQPTEFYDALALKTLRRSLDELLRALVRKLLPVKGDAEAKLDSLGTGRATFDALASLGDDQLGPAALMVVTDRIRGVLR